MNKVAHYLQEHISGEVMTGNDARKYFSTDSSIFTITPSVIVYPKNENDVRKIARFTWQLAERGRTIPLTARGSGTDLTGAAIGSGVLIVFPSHLNQVKYYDAKTEQIIAEVGINFGKLQQLLLSYDRFIPAAPASMEYSTLGGAVANNASSKYSLKYGDMRKSVQGLRVVLSNGEIIETRKLSKKELNRKLGLSTFEGEIYRSIDTLLEEKKDIVSKSILNVSRNSFGYNLSDVKNDDSSFDLTPLLVGSQGSLGLITEVTMGTSRSRPMTTLLSAYLNSADDLQATVIQLRSLDEMPSAIEVVDGSLLESVAQENPNYLKEVIASPFPKFVLLVEFDTENEHKRHKLVKKASKILSQYSSDVVVEEDKERQKIIWKVREASALYSGHNQGQLNPLPLIDDGIVPLDKLSAFINAIYDQFNREHLQVAIWGHAGDANLHAQPYLNLGQVGDRQKAFRMLEDYCRTIKDLGGSLSAQYNDGRLRGSYLSKIYPEDVYQLFVQVKKVFDPYNILNPGVKIGVSNDEIKPQLRNEYSLQHIYDHLPLS